MADDARGPLPPPRGSALVPARQSGRDLIASARAAAARPVPGGTAVQARPVEAKGMALVTQLREAAARPAPARPNPPEPEPPITETPAPASPAAAPPSSSTAVVPAPATAVVPVEVAPGQTVPIEIPQTAAAAGQPIVVNVNVVNEQRGGPWWWGPYWYGYPDPYWRGCGRRNCPHLVGQVCNRWICG